VLVDIDGLTHSLTRSHTRARARAHTHTHTHTHTKGGAAQVSGRIFAGDVLVDVDGLSVAHNTILQVQQVSYIHVYVYLYIFNVDGLSVDRNTILHVRQVIYIYR